MHAPSEPIAGPRDDVDLLVVGGGINGVGIARDAAGRGLSVLLCERGDLAGATSSASSKLIHGGLRYLEQCAFRLVRESLAEREVLMRIAPHLVRPRRFVLPHERGARSRWLIRTGLFLYDHLGGPRSLPGTQSLRFAGDALGAPLQQRLRDGFAYSDCVVDDSRLVVVNARDAKGRGAEIATRTALVAARRDGRRWRATLETPDGRQRAVEARILVNAAGPWAENVLRRAGLRSRAGLRLVKGSHIVVRRLYDGEHAYLLQNEDGRVVFVIPYQRDFTLIGTTDLPVAGEPDEVRIEDAETEYLCRAVSRYFRAPLSPAEVVWSYAGIRPLYDDRAASAAAVTRDYVLELDRDGPPVLSVFGGKLTTYRRLAEHALAKLGLDLGGARGPWTAHSLLPGAEGLPPGGPDALARELRAEHPILDERTADRLAHSYGADARRILDGAAQRPALGRDLGGVGEREVAWMVAEEWARTPEDVLWRRSKLGLQTPPETLPRLAAYLDATRRPAMPDRAAAETSAP
ncbi:MAG: glycerol-3-phosphate dehydrogenase [Alphaproteobacteria bacterium]|nr:glycerol-3-phosphate dehydrogenase [Alphaproteobacteria bacterium]